MSAQDPATDHEASKAAAVAAEDAYDRIADAQEALLAGAHLVACMRRAQSLKTHSPSRIRM